MDDNTQSAESLALIIELWGHECRVAFSGDHGLAIAREFGPDLILLDIGLPGMNGYDVASTLRRDPSTKNIVLIAITGYGRDEDRVRSAEAGFDRHFLKPLDLHLLETLLAETACTSDRGSGLGSS